VHQEGLNGCAMKIRQFLAHHRAFPAIDDDPK